MRTFKLLILLAVVFIPSAAYAWGPLTHMYLGSEIITLGSLLPAAVYKLIRKYRNDFLYGNLMADSIIGKQYLPDEKNSHSWDVAFDLFREAQTDQQKAFVYGYMGHLAADTVAHNKYTNERKNIGHTIVELKADSIIDRKYWFQALTIEKKIQARNDIFLENSLERLLFSFKTNKRIFKSVIFLSALSPEKISNFFDRNIVSSMPLRAEIEDLHRESLDRMLDLLQKGAKSTVTGFNPGSTNLHSGRLKTFIKRLS